MQAFHHALPEDIEHRSPRMAWRSGLVRQVSEGSRSTFSCSLLTGGVILAGLMRPLRSEMKRRLYTVSSEHRKRLVSRLRAALEREPAVRFAYLYGSVLESDRVHDVGLYLQKDALAGGAEISEALSANLTAEVGMPMDFRTLNEAPLSFQYHALRGRLLVCNDEDFLTDLIEDVARRYLDLAPLLRRGTKDAFAA